MSTVTDLVRVRQIGSVVRLHDPYAHACIVIEHHAVPGYPEDLAAVVRYRDKTQERHWALVQRVGPVWSATLKLSVEEAVRRALLAVGKDPDGHLDRGADDAPTRNS